MTKERQQRDQKLGQLMQAAQGGDQQAYRELLQESERIILAFLRSRLGQNSEDVAQEALLGLHKARHTFQPGRSYVTWLLSITKYKYIDYLRKWSRTVGREVIDEAILDNIIAPEWQDPANTSLREDLQMAIDALPVMQKRTITLLKIEGLSVKETAAKLGASEAAVKTTAHRAYKSLRKRLRRI